MAAPTILAFGTEEQKQRYLRPLWCGEEVWCQLFSEPGAGSDLAGLSTRAVLDGDTWIVNGQKVWTSSAHIADRAIMIVRTDPDQPKHAGLSYFILDMHDPGVEVRPLRQITGEAEFNEVFLTDARIPDSDRLGEVGEGWKVANATLSNERVAIGGGAFPREFGMVMNVAETWRERPELRTPETHERLLRGWIDTEVARITATRLRQKMAAGVPGPEGSAMKLSFARINQQLSALEVDLLGDDGLRYESWEMRRPDPGRLLRQGRRLPLPARQGQLDRGRYVGGAAQRGLRADPRPAHRAPRRQGRPLEGPAPMTSSPLPPTSTCSPTTSRPTCAPRCARCSRSTRRPTGVNAIYDGTDDVTGPLWSAFVELGLAGPAGARGPRWRRRHGARGRGRARGDRPGGRALAVPDLERRRHDRPGRAAATRRSCRRSPRASRPPHCWCGRRRCATGRARARRTGGSSRRGRAPRCPDGRRAVRRTRRDASPPVALARHDPPARRGRPRRRRADAGLRRRGRGDRPGAADRRRAARRRAGRDRPLGARDDDRLPEGASSVRPRRRRLPGAQAPARRPVRRGRAGRRGRPLRRGDAGRPTTPTPRSRSRSRRPSAARSRCTPPRRRSSCTAASA